MDSLQGSFLIATPKMPDPRFAEAVIFMCAHNDEGAMGLVINHPIADLTLEEIFANANLPIPDHELPPVYLGGPVETSSAFFLYSSEYQAESFIEVTPAICLSRDPQILYDIAEGYGPRRYLVALGYSGWGPGQLENELTMDGWLTLPAHDEIIFSTADELKWRKAALIHGIDITLFGDVAGSA